MESLLKTCVSSASYILSGTEIWQSKDKDVADHATLYQNRHPPSTHYPHSKGGSVGPITQYKPYNCPNPISNTKGNLTSEKATLMEAQMLIAENEAKKASLKNSIARNGIENISWNGIEGIPTSTSTTTCPSIPLKPWPSHQGSEGRWVRPLGYAERFMTTAGTWGNMSTVYALWLDSSRPVTYESIQTTSRLIFRKMLHLRLCINTHQNDRWWKEMDAERLDIEEIRTSDIIGTFESLLKRRYNIEEGPLWFIRFITSPDGEGLVRDSNFNLKRKYVCIFGFHHNVSDGTTNMSFCNIFISLLNDVLQGKVPDMKEEGRFALPLHDPMADAARSLKFDMQLFMSRIFKGLIMYCEYVKNFVTYYPMPLDQEGQTRVLSNELDEITTERLLKRCKMEGVTLNTAFTAAANIGMYRLVLQRDGSVDNTRFDNQQAVNMRRYWPKEERANAYGCHISMLDIQVPTKKEDIENFWEYARKVHKIIGKDLIEEKRALKMLPMCEKLWMAVFVNSLMSKLQIPSSNDSHYCITNMGDVTATFAHGSDSVQVSNILRSVSCHFMQTLCQHTLQTLRGKFYYSLDYYPQKMSADTARAYVSSLMDTLRSVIHLPN